MQDKDGNEYQALTTLFTWKAGLSVGDIRANALVRNVDAAKITGKMSAADKLALIEKFVVAKNRIRALKSRDKRVVMYVSESLYNWFEIYLLDKTNVHVTRQELAADVPRLYFGGIEIKMCDAISDEEPAVPVV